MKNLKDKLANLMEAQIENKVMDLIEKKDSGIKGNIEEIKKLDELIEQEEKEEKITKTERGKDKKGFFLWRFIKWIFRKIFGK